MFPPFPQREAYGYCTLLAEQVRRERLFAKDVMIGVCVCRAKNGAKVILRAFSGMHDGGWLIDGWAPPCFDAYEYDRQAAAADAEIRELAGALAGLDAESDAERRHLMQERRQCSRRWQQKLASLYRFYCADGHVRSFGDILGGFPHSLAPTGCGDCCAPKLLSYAFRRGLAPVSLCELYVGSGSRARRSGRVYPPCDDKCALVLPALLRLKIIYRDRYVIVINKPAGLLSVPGRGAHMQDCAVTRVKRLFAHCISQPAVHRLDMDTSGLLVLAFTREAHRALSMQFQNGQVYKEYTALLDGTLARPLRIAGAGTISLAFRLDPADRPRQIYDPVHGKTGITEWTVIREELVKSGTCAGRRYTRVRFVPRTGRTHQLRVHSAHPLGLGVPIAGDRLYGRGGARLMLHASVLSFTHPVTGSRLTFACAAPF